MLADTAVQLCILGTGEKTLESQLRELAKKFPKKLGIKIAYNETWAHMCIAGGNAFLMPSRFEPCGLTQLYSLRYGTLPIARNVGGLADTIVDATPANIKNQTATGFLFDEDSAESLFDSISHALTLYANKTLWKKLQLTAMKQDFSWNSAAESYMQLYQEIRRDLLGDRHL
jgi:starch synthase